MREIAVVPRRRLYRLVPWLVRAVVPDGLPGNYTLFKGGTATYVGRSDTDLRRRLVGHARAERAEFFDFEPTSRVRAAFLTECASYHAITGLRNVIHPATPSGSDERCPFCRETAIATLNERLQPGT